jgi:GT2 family glycosyltransferase
VPPSLSIVIPTHNRPDLLRACLQSVVLHMPPRTDVLVVDDASPGNCALEVVRAFTHVRCMRLPRQRGFAAAANAGARAVTAPFVELLNDDTEVTAGWAEAALDGFRHERVAAVAPLVLIHQGVDKTGSKNHPRLDSAGDRYFRGGVAGKRGHGRTLKSGEWQPRLVFGASASSAFYRRDQLQEIGGFPESFGAYFEDVDVAFRFHWAGWRVRFEPASQVWHHVSSSYGKANRRLLETQSRNEERVFWRNVPRRALVRSLPVHAAVLAGKVLKRWDEGTLLPFVTGRLRILGEIRDLRCHRRQLHRDNPDADWADWEVGMSMNELDPTDAREP